MIKHLINANKCISETQYQPYGELIPVDIAWNYVLRNFAILEIFR